MNKETIKNGKSDALAVHVPVFTREILDLLAPEKGKGLFVDFTVGGGGHSEALLERMGEECFLYGFDVDPAMIAKAERRLSRHRGRYELICEDYRNAVSLLGKKNRGKGGGNDRRHRIVFRSP